MRTGILLLLTLIGTACTDPLLPELEPNLLGLDDPACFTDVRVTSRRTSETRADVTLAFTSIYNQLKPAQQNRITGIEVNGGTGIVAFTIPAQKEDLLLKQLRIGQPYHLTLQFLADDASLPVTDVRFTP